jgi:hypothetical protein
MIRRDKDKTIIALLSAFTGLFYIACGFFVRNMARDLVTLKLSGRYFNKGLIINKRDLIEIELGRFLLLILIWKLILDSLIAI